MTGFFKQNLDTAFEAAVGEAGANRERQLYWLTQLVPAIARIQSSPQREAAPLLNLPGREDDLAEIENIAVHIANNFKTLVVAGMGGSSLSAETLMYLRKPKPGRIRLKFIDNIDPHSIDTLMQELEWKDTAFLVISKSGNTVESLAQMSVLLKHAKAKLPHYGQHFFVITITDGNPLHTLAKKHSIRVLAHDPALGGRFSILSAVGLIPAAAAGINIRALRAGAKAVLAENFGSAIGNAPAAQAAALHRALMEKNIRANVLLHYSDRMTGLALWHRQCWGESLGKSDLATTPAPARGSTDQHSQLQLYLDGPKDKFFSVMMLECAGQGEAIDYPGETDERLDFLKGKTMGDLMVAEQKATLETLVSRGCPSRSFTMPHYNEETLGALLMHFSLEIMFTAELMGVNAFDQPAVEDSKKLALRYLAEI